MTILKKLYKKYFRPSPGFTLIEVIIFATIASYVLTTSMSIVAKVVQRMQTDEHKIMATHYAEETLEWLKAERESMDWKSFTLLGSIGTGKIYCVNNALTLDVKMANLSNQSCTFTGVVSQDPLIFKRELTLIIPSSSQTTPEYVQVNINVQWHDAGVLYSVPLSTTFSVWE